MGAAELLTTVKVMSYSMGGGGARCDLTAPHRNWNADGCVPLNFSIRALSLMSSQSDSAWTDARFGAGDEHIGGEGAPVSRLNPLRVDLQS